MWVEWKRNVMAHAQKPDSVFQRNGWVHLYRWGCQFSRVLAFLECGSENDFSTLDGLFRVKLKTPGYPLHSPLSPSLLLLCVAVCHQIPFPLYQVSKIIIFQLNVKWFILLCCKHQDNKIILSIKHNLIYRGISLTVFNKLSPGCVQGSRKIRLYSCNWQSLNTEISILLQYIHDTNVKKKKSIKIYKHKPFIQGVPGGMCETSGECSLC